jgi:nucleoid DNA-binding protein
LELSSVTKNYKELEKIFVEHIIELLKHHECVSLPGFGGFILKPVSASVNNHVFTPPHKQIAFNKNLTQDDGLLTGAIMGSENFDYAKAKNEVGKFSNSLSFTLKKNGTLTLDGLGKFYLSANDTIRFQPAIAQAFDKNSFGLQSIQAQPVIRKVVKENPRKKQPDTTENKRLKSVEKRYKAALATIVMLMGGIITLMITDTHIQGTKIENAHFLSTFFASEAAENIIITKESKTEAAFTPSVQRDEIAQNGFEFLSIRNTAIPYGYFVVVGSYASKANAERMERELFTRGYDSYISETENGLYRVAVFAATGYTAAISKLQSMKAENSQYWLVKNLP